VVAQLAKDWERTHTHMSFPNRPIRMCEMALQDAALKPHLTLTMPAVVTLLTAFLVDHSVTATLGTEVACDA
jgi:hypothetical protein